MADVWNIKLIYSIGSHLVRGDNGEPLRFPSKQLAVFECETLNAKRKDRDNYYIAVEEEKYR